MQKATLLLMLLAMPALLPAQQPNPQRKSLVFTHVTVIDATGAPAKPDMTVVITSDRITEIGRSGKLRLPKDAQLVDATGRFLMPGLWDTHVHWFLKDYLSLFIANGVTGARQMWGVTMHHEWRQEIRRNSNLIEKLSQRAEQFPHLLYAWSGLRTMPPSVKRRYTGVVYEAPTPADAVALFKRWLLS